MRAKSLLWPGVLVLLAAAPAEARFGKRTAGGSSNSKEDAPRARSQNTHSATPVGGCCASAPGSAAPAPSYAPARVAPAWPYRHRGGGFWGAGYVPAYWAPAYAPQVEAREEPSSAPVRVTVGAEGMAFPGGASAGLSLGFEGERAGFNATYNHLVVAASDGSGGLDKIEQLNAHLTYAVLAGSYGRLRLEGGADSAFAPDLTVVGPSVGASGVVWVAGPVALEASVTVTPFPFRQVDARAGLGLGLGVLGVRAGWRALVLDDAGLVDGVIHRDLFSGPYVGLALAF